jgi:MFS family permease
VNAVAEVVGQLGGYRRLLGIRDYRLLWAAQLVSTYGDRLSQLALAALVYGTTGSVMGLALVLTISELPRAALGLLAGAVADRVSRKTLLIVADCARALIVLVLALWAGVPILIVYCLAALHATATVFFSPARYAVLPDIVPREDLLNANTLDETTQDAFDPVAFLVGGALVAIAGTRVAFGVDSLTFLLSAGLIAMTTTRSAALWRAQRDAPRAVHVEAAEGVRVLFRDPVLRANTILMLIACIVASSDTLLTYVLVFSHWERGAFGLGVFEALLAVGFVLGAFACGPVVAWLGKGDSIILGLVGTGFCMALLAALPFWPAAFVNGVSGVFNILFFVPAITLAQERAPCSSRARVISSRGALLAVGIFASYAMATALTTWIAPADLLTAMGAALTVLAAAAALVPTLRER